MMITFDWSCQLGSAVQYRRLKSGSLAAPSEAAELQLLRFFFTFATISDSGTNPSSRTP